MNDDEFARHYNMGRRSDRRMPFDIFVVVVMLLGMAALVTWLR